MSLRVYMPVYSMCARESFVEFLGTHIHVVYLTVCEYPYGEYPYIWAYVKIILSTAGCFYLVYVSSRISVGFLDLCL